MPVTRANPQHGPGGRTTARLTEAEPRCLQAGPSFQSQGWLAGLEFHASSDMRKMDKRLKIHYSMYFNLRPEDRMNLPES